MGFLEDLKDIKKLEEFTKSIVHKRELEFNEEKIEYNEKTDFRHKQKEKYINKIIDLLSMSFSITTEDLEKIKDFFNKKSSETARVYYYALNFFREMVNDLNFSDAFCNYEEYKKNVYEAIEEGIKKYKLATITTYFDALSTISSLLFDKPIPPKKEWGLERSISKKRYKKNPADLNSLIVFLKCMDELIYETHDKLVYEGVPHTILNKINFLTLVNVRFAFYLIMMTGLRAVEVCRIRKEDFYENHGKYYLCVIGKGLRKRIIPIPKTTYNILNKVCEINDVAKNDEKVFKEYVIDLNDLRKLIFKFDREKYWIKMKEGKRDLNKQTLFNIVNIINQRIKNNFEAYQEFFKNKGISIERYDIVTLHKLRHLYATYLYFKTKDILGIMEKLGHSNVNYTMIYAKYLKETDDTPKVVEDLFISLRKISK